ncbi:hypothetical protein ACGFZL_31980 [Streptomyces sp. NPDC048182]|uniref:hypothetical protein n=1 Tax=Streptomyces sp. NPDC048182 TaxID=3365507 RepID=UPI0037165B8A
MPPTGASHDLTWGRKQPRDGEKQRYGREQQLPVRTEVQQLLGVNSFGLWRLVRKYDDFPQPTEPPYDPIAVFSSRKEPEEVWDGFQVYRWAAHTPEFTHRGAVLLRPLPEDVAPGRWAGCKDTVRGPALDWHTVLGTIRLVHCDDRRVATDVATEVAGRGNPDGVAVVCALYGDMSFRGPALVAADPRTRASSTRPTGATSRPWPGRTCPGGPPCCACRT